MVSVGEERQSSLAVGPNYALIKWNHERVEEGGVVANAAAIALRSNMTDEDQASPKRAFWLRATDKTKWPRSWLQPNTTLDLGYADGEPRRNAADEVQRTIRRVMLTLVGYCFFCWLTLGAPDASIIDAAATIKVPFANVEISYVNFLIIGPLIAIVIWIYLQVFVGLHEGLSRNDPFSTGLPFLFNINQPMPRMISRVLLYWLAPLTVTLFVFKALPRSEGPWLVILAAIFFAAMFWLLISRRPHGKI